MYLCNLNFKKKGFALQEIVDALDRLGLDWTVDSANHNEELLKIEFAFQLGRLQNVQALNKYSELFNNIRAAYFVDPENFAVK